MSLQYVKNYFEGLFHFYTPWKRQKRQKTRGFLKFSGDIEIEDTIMIKK